MDCVSDLCGELNQVMKQTDKKAPIRASLIRFRQKMNLCRKEPEPCGGEIGVEGERLF